MGDAKSRGSRVSRPAAVDRIIGCCGIARVSARVLIDPAITLIGLHGRIIAKVAQLRDDFNYTSENRAAFPRYRGK